jgi:general stress protein 26
MTVTANNELVSRAKELLDSLIYGNIATVSLSGLPWNTPVYSPWDHNLNFYWSSWIESEHSKNIKFNPNVFITFYDSTRLRGTNSLRCLYLQATAEELTATEEILLASKLLYGEEKVEPTTFLGDSVKRLYKAIPSRVWLNDLSEREVTPETVKMRIELPLSELRALCRSNQRNIK